MTKNNYDTGVCKSCMLKPFLTPRLPPSVCDVRLRQEQLQQQNTRNVQMILKMEKKIYLLILARVSSSSTTSGGKSGKSSKSESSLGALISS